VGIAQVYRAHGWEKVEGGIPNDFLVKPLATERQQTEEFREQHNDVSVEKWGILVENQYWGRWLVEHYKLIITNIGQ
jgi:hypothetical protein